MKRVTGREMRSLILAVTLMTLVLVIGVITYFMVDVILTTNNNIEKNKQMTLNQTLLAMEKIGEKVIGISGDPDIFAVFNQDYLLEILGGNEERLYELATELAVGMNSLEYAAIARDGEIVMVESRPGLTLGEDDLPAGLSAGDYRVLDMLGGREGYFVTVAYPIDLSAYGFEPFTVVFAMDRTAEMQDIDDYFVDQRNALVLRMSIAAGIAVLLTLLVTTIGLRYFTRKYVMDPLQELNRMAEEIADGTFEGEVKVDRESAYAALQGLLRSGQVILSKMDRETR